MTLNLAGIVCLPNIFAMMILASTIKGLLDGLRCSTSTIALLAWSLLLTSGRGPFRRLSRSMGRSSSFPSIFTATWGGHSNIEVLLLAHLIFEE